MTATRRRRTRPAAVVCAVALLSAGTAGCGLVGGDDTKRLTASFDRTVGLYEESDVRILGVAIGKVTKIEPQGQTVRVEMEYDGKYKIPAEDAAAGGAEGDGSGGEGGGSAPSGQAAHRRLHPLSLSALNSPQANWFVGVNCAASLTL